MASDTMIVPPTWRLKMTQPRNPHKNKTGCGERLPVTLSEIDLGDSYRSLGREMALGRCQIQKTCLSVFPIFHSCQTFKITRIYKGTFQFHNLFVRFPAIQFLAL